MSGDGSVLRAAEAIVRERLRFLATGEAPAGIRPEILTSWRRCSAFNVPEAPEPPYLAAFDSDSRLLRAARAVLDHVSERLGELPCAFILTDPEARILARWVCEPSMTKLLEKTNAVEGFVFSEDLVGTNGMGTAAELGRTTRVDGGEHYAEQYHTSTCVGVPIMDRIGHQLAGVLDVNCPVDPDNQFVTLLAEQTARSIEDVLVEERSRLERVLLDQFMVERRGSPGLVVVSERVLMTDPHAARLLNGVDQPLIWEHATRALGQQGSVEDEVPNSTGGLVAMRMRALYDGGDAIGVLIRVKSTIEGVRGAVAAAVPPPRPVTPDWFVAGDGGPLLEAFRRCRDARRDELLVVTGESGAGKLALLQAVHEQAGQGTFRVCDLAGMPPGPDRWAVVPDDAAEGEGLLVLQHADQLSADDHGPLVAAARQAAAAGWRVAFTVTQRPSAERPLPELDGPRVGVPPLRNRMQDVPRLAAGFAAPRRLAAETVQLLMRLSWPGNVRELRSVVERMTGNSMTGTVDLSAVPPEVRSAAHRHPITRFEHAELHAILDALAEAGGSKRAAARLLGISRSTLYRKLQAAGVDLDNTVY